MGQRYRQHQKLGSRVLLFVRDSKTERVTGQPCAYTYLGTARFMSYDGSKPMNIIWRLDNPIPAKFLKKTDKLAVG